MSVEPAVKRAMVFVDGQNLFHAVKNAFAYTYPNYDVSTLAAALCRPQAWTVAGALFYTARGAPVLKNLVCGMLKGSLAPFVREWDLDHGEGSYRVIVR